MMEKEIVMRRNGFLWPACRALGMLICLSPAWILAQQPNPNDFSFSIRVDKQSYAPGDTVQATMGMTAKATGAQGWSYGVRHDPAVMELQTVNTDSTDVPSVFNGGFNTTTIITENGVKVGYIQAIVLSFISQAEVPITDFFSFCATTYTVKADACTGKNGDFESEIKYVHKEIGVPNSPPVDINLTVNGQALGPDEGLRTDPVQAKITCGGTGEGGLALKFDRGDTDVVADTSSTLDIKVLMSNTQTTGAGFDVQGWSYGLQIDTAELEAVKGEPGADSKALQGGKGPDFTNYNLNDQSADGQVHGVTVGVVIELDAPGTAVLAVGPGASKHIDTIQVRSKQQIPTGGQSRTTQAGFSDKLGGDRPLEVLAVVAGEGIVPDFTDKLDITLLPGADNTKPQFIRGDSNNDARVDIADGIWIINELFYGGTATACKLAADANADGTRNITDAMYIFNYQLQPGATPGNLFPAPPAPYPNCGTVDGATLADCPNGSTTCTQ
jgi:hypothetical protein